MGIFSVNKIFNYNLPQVPNLREVTQYAYFKNLTV